MFLQKRMVMIFKPNLVRRKRIKIIPILKKIGGVIWRLFIGPTDVNRVSEGLKLKPPPTHYFNIDGGP
jgi:hypothetical protein